MRRSDVSRNLKKQESKGFSCEVAKFKCAYVSLHRLTSGSRPTMMMIVLSKNSRKQIETHFVEMQGDANEIELIERCIVQGVMATAWVCLVNTIGQTFTSESTFSKH